MAANFFKLFFSCAGQRLSVSDHASFESSILPGTPLPGIAEETKNKKNAVLVAAQAATTVAAPTASALAKATLAELKHYHFGSLEKETAGLPIASDPDLIVSPIFRHVVDKVISEKHLSSPVSM